MNKPKRCPKCGHAAVYVWRILGTYRFTVECGKCNYFGKVRMSKRWAIRAWNRESVKAHGRA